MGTHKVKKQTDEKTLDNEQKAFELRTKGWTQLRIAKELGISQAAISGILQRVNKKYTKLFMSRVDDVKTEQVAIHQRIVDDALEAWSKSRRKITIVKDGIKIEKESLGETRYLETSMKAMEHIRKIVGVGTEDEEAERDPIFEKVVIEVIDRRTLEAESELTNSSQA